MRPFLLLLPLGAEAGDAALVDAEAEDLGAAEVAAAVEAVDPAPEGEVFALEAEVFDGSERLTSAEALLCCGVERVLLFFPRVFREEVSFLAERLSS